jgi:septal ring factor EnvC (AmiA/AmiB activator)
MPRKSLRPNLNQIRAWVRQGRTDAWVAHQLEVSVRDIEQFKRQNDLVEEDATEATTASDYPDEIDLRAEDDALIAAELEAAELEAERARAEAEAKAAQEPDSDSEEDDDAPRTRPRRRRGGRGRRVLGSRAGTGNSGPLEGTFDHGEEGYGLWLDPAIQDNPIYAEHWAGHRPVEVAVEEDCIIIRRTAEDD